MHRLICLFLLAFLASCSTKTNTDLDVISFQQGYFYAENLDVCGVPCPLDSFLEGIKAYREGKELPFTEDEIASARVRFEKKYQDEEKRKNLAFAEGFLAKVKGEMEEILPGKLYAEILQKGSGSSYEKNEMVDVSFTLSILKEGKLQEIFSQEHSEISVIDTVRGFRLGIVGMQVGERRKIVIHPDLAYGSHVGRLPPNQLVTIEVEMHRFW